ncbi:uncharacterized protein LOC113335541 [Papaver somniferum]|uniref:uncharacterized protein LOC113335541 n=1 Tax=Papaver somniferum TaxID=3469 RepID=UPI000E6FDEF7|nr:uncharacterized protein LOC113335541 [Papaver somniferum]
MNQRQHIVSLFEKQSIETVAKNRLCLITSIWCIQWLAFQGCTFRGSNESKDSKNRWNFLELVKFSTKLNKDICEVVLDNARGNAKYISPAIQKEILNIFAVKVREKIHKDIGNVKFWILVDESKDNSGIKQMATIVRYVDKEGNFQEPFFDVQNFRGQGYDGANNMRGAMDGLQALFLKDCPYAYYVPLWILEIHLGVSKLKIFACSLKSKSVVYREIDKIIRLVLTLHVSTETAERVFSAMNCVKTTIWNKMGQDFLNDSMMIYIERLLA